MSRTYDFWIWSLKGIGLFAAWVGFWSGLTLDPKTLPGQLLQGEWLIIAMLGIVVCAVCDVGKILANILASKKSAAADTAIPSLRGIASAAKSGD